jgi:hypothetical protein
VRVRTARITFACAAVAGALTILVVASRRFTPAFAHGASRSIAKLRSQTIDLPFGDRQFRGGKWAEVANGRCLVCHSRGMIDIQPQMPLAAWKAEIRKMRLAYGAALGDEDEVDGLAQFMYELNHANHSPPADPARGAALEGGRLKSDP